MAAALLPIGKGILDIAAAAGPFMGVLGKKKRKTIDPEWLKANFGANAVNQEVMDLFNRAINSVQGQQLMAGAAEGGQQFGRDVQRQAAGAGLTGGGGAASGAGIFATAAGEGAANAEQRQTKASMMQAMLPIAQQIVQDRMKAYMGDYAQTQASPFQETMLSQAGPLVGELAGQGLQKIEAGQRSKGLQKYTSDLASQPGATAPAQPLIPRQVPRTQASLGSLVDTGGPVASAGPMTPEQYGIVGGRFAGRRMGRFRSMMGAVQPAMA